MRRGKCEKYSENTSCAEQGISEDILYKGIAGMDGALSCNLQGNGSA